MDWPTLLWLSGLIVGVYDLANSYKSTFAATRPTLSAVVVLAVAGFAVIITASFSGRVVPSPIDTSNGSLPLVETHELKTRDASKIDAVSTDDRFSLHRLRATFAGLVVACCVRVELTTLILSQTQCSHHSLTPWIPLLLMVYEWLSSSASPGLTFFVHPFKYISSTHMSEFWSIPPALLMTGGGAFLFSRIAEPQSTIICARVLPYRYMIPIFQIIATCFDLLIIISASQLLFRGKATRHVAAGKVGNAVGWAFVLSSSLLLVIGAIVIFFKPELRQSTQNLPPEYIRSVARISFNTSVIIVCALRILVRFGLKTSSVVIAFASFNLAGLFASRASSSIFSSLSPLTTISAFSLIFAGFILFLWINVQANRQLDVGAATRDTRISKTICGILAFLYVFQVTLWLFHTADLTYSQHPIDVLMENADQQYQTWSEQASASSSLSSAIANYQKRYSRNPPPRFDQWYKYATDRNSVVIDDFDQIMDDLAPFWSIPPAILRLRTFEMVSNDWNAVGGIIIQDHKMELSPHIPGGNVWMLHGLMQMIENFVEWLPDMIIAFNLNDECRVAVDYEAKSSFINDMAKPQKLSIATDSDFSTGRERTWKKVSKVSHPRTRFFEQSWQPTFRDFGIIGCPPNSPARHENLWDLSALCSHCTQPHSFRQFVSNWSLAADPCHQPDLANLHGLHRSPAAFRNTHHLMPIFSQSKSRGYNDILYPSAWNYMDKALYAPTEDQPDLDWSEKDSTLFWRGATSEGVSMESGAWKGFVRQRLVHYFNNASADFESLVLLPSKDVIGHDLTSSGSPAFIHQRYTPSELHKQLSTSVRFVDHVERCGPRDCAAQEKEFAPQYVSGIDFQGHWRYKYLFDVDGAGFSGRFLAFLASKSLPFKAGLMREWWESRVHAWKHFVPVDVRLAESWSLLAYFQGWKKNPEHRENEEPDWLMLPHDQEAISIAESGREWANKALRKEDMEIYMFRLLLEWARLTDDNRDALE